MINSKQLLAYGILAGLLLGVPALAAPDGTQQDAVEEIAQATTEVVAPPSDAPPPPGDVPPPLAWHHHGPGHCGPQHPLSDDQLEKMSALKDAFMSAIATERTQLKILHQQMEDLMTRPACDRTAVLALQAKVNALRDSIATKAVNYQLDKMAILTPEQRHDMRHHELMENVFGRMGGGMCGHIGDPGHGPDGACR